MEDFGLRPPTVLGSTSGNAARNASREAVSIPSFCHGCQKGGSCDGNPALCCSCERNNNDFFSRTSGPVKEVLPSENGQLLGHKVFPATSNGPRLKSAMDPQSCADSHSNHDFSEDLTSPFEQNLDRYRQYRKRKRKELSKKTGKVLWSDDVEDEFQSAIRIIRPMGRLQVLVPMENGTSKRCGKNELIQRRIFRYTGKWVDRKQISSHIQNLKKMFPVDHQWVGVVATGQEAGATDFVKQMVWDDDLCMLVPRDPAQPSDTRQKEGMRSHLELGRLEAGSRLLTGLQFQMCLHPADRDETSELEIYHTYTTMQESEHGARPKKLEEMSDWKSLFPELHRKLHVAKGSIEEIILLEANFDLEDIETAGRSRLGVHFFAYLHSLGVSRDWRNDTTFYEGGKKVKSVSHPVTMEEIGSSTTCAELSLDSTWWVTVFSQIYARRKQDDQSMEADVQHSFERMTAMQEIYPLSEPASHPKMIFLWLFRQAKPDQSGTTTWRRIIPPRETSHGSSAVASGASWPSSANARESDEEPILQQPTPTVPWLAPPQNSEHLVQWAETHSDMFRPLQEVPCAEYLPSQPEDTFPGHISEYPGQSATSFLNEGNPFELFEAPASSYSAPSTQILRGMQPTLAEDRSGSIAKSSSAVADLASIPNYSAIFDAHDSNLKTLFAGQALADLAAQPPIADYASNTLTDPNLENFTAGEIVLNYDLMDVALDSSHGRMNEVHHETSSHVPHLVGQNGIVSSSAYEENQLLATLAVTSKGHELAGEGVCLYSTEHGNREVGSKDLLQSQLATNLPGVGDRVPDMDDFNLVPPKSASNGERDPNFDDTILKELMSSANHLLRRPRTRAHHHPRQYRGSPYPIQQENAEDDPHLKQWTVRRSPRRHPQSKEHVRQAFLSDSTAINASNTLQRTASRIGSRDHEQDLYPPGLFADVGHGVEDGVFGDGGMGENVAQQLVELCGGNRSTEKGFSS